MGLIGVKFGMALGIIALLADIFALTLPWWTYSTEEKFGEVWVTNSGLWENCNHVTDVFGEIQYKCIKIQEPDEYIRLTRNMCLVGLFFLICGLCVTSIGRCIFPEYHLMPLVGGLATILAGFLIWLGVLLFTSNYIKTAGNEPWDIHAAWGLGLSSAFLCFITCILFLWDKRKENNENDPEPEDKKAGSQVDVTPASWRTNRKESWKPRYLDLTPRSSYSGGSSTPVESISKSDLHSRKQ